VKDLSEEELVQFAAGRLPPVSAFSAQWHLRQVERILMDEQERESALGSSGKYGMDELHDAKIATWKLMEKIPEDL